MFTRCFYIFIKINILKASVDFYAINTFVTCESNMGLLLCHKPFETIGFKAKFCEPLRSIKFFGDNRCFVFVERYVLGVL